MGIFKKGTLETTAPVQPPVVENPKVEAPKVEVPVQTKPLALPWDGKHKDSAKWTAALVDMLAKSPLIDANPDDIKDIQPNWASFTKEQRIAFFANLISIMAKHESSYKPESKYTEDFDDSKGNNVVSRGLLQISIESANSYGAKLTDAQQLHDPITNLKAGILILERWIVRDDVLFGKKDDKWLGVGRYWAVGRSIKNGKPRESYTNIVKHLKSLDLGDVKATPAPVEPEKPVETPKLTKVPSIDVKTKRKLPEKLEKLIDEKLMKLKPEELLKACAEKDANKICALAGEALVELGVREKTNKNDGEIVEMIQKIAGGSKGQAWCMYAVQTCIGYAEKKTGLVSSVYNSGSCASVRRSTPKAHQISVEDSQAGDVWIWIYDTGLGHTGTFQEWKSKMTTAILSEGNTTKGLENGKIVREGGGMYQTERDVKIPGMKLGMVVRPFLKK